MNQEDHINNVLALIYDNENPEIGAIKMSIAVYLRNFVRQMVGRMGSDELTP